MTLSELIPQRYEFGFGEARIVLRYDMSALLALERSGLEYSDIFAEKITVQALCAFLDAGAGSALGDKRCEQIVRAIGAEQVFRHVRAAVMLSLPEPDPLIIPEPTKSGGETDYGLIRTLICDVMKKDEEFFWKSTLRELLGRWQKYAVAKGYAKPPKRMELYDTEGM